MNVIEKYICLPRKHLALFQFIIEGYEGMATVTATDAHAAVVKVSIMPGFCNEIWDIMQALQKELDIHWTSA